MAHLIQIKEKILAPISITSLLILSFFQLLRVSKSTSKQIGKITIVVKQCPRYTPQTYPNSDNALF